MKKNSHREEIQWGDRAWFPVRWGFCPSEKAWHRFMKVNKADPVIPPFLTGHFGRIYAAIANFWAGVMPPMPILGRSLL